MDNREAVPFLRRNRIVIDSKVEVKYPEKTWSVEQSYRDIYQNHLDAQVKLSVDGLLSDITHAVDGDTEAVLQNDGLRKVAYEYLATKGHVPKDVKTQMVDFLVKNVKGKVEREDEELARLVEEHRLFLPKVEVLSRDDADKETWVDKNSLDLDTLRELRILGFRISDEGGGYDANLKTIFYSSGKDSPDQVGKFGEGGKMSEILLQQKGFAIESRSAYSYDDIDGHHDMLWKGRPRVSKEGSMELHVTQVELSAPIPTGSITEVVFRNPDIDDSDLRQITDCIKSLGQPQIIFDEHRRAGDWFYYTSYDPSKPLLGVSREYDSIMVQGIRVEPVNTDSTLLFGYSTFDKNALNARDRNKYTPEFLEGVNEFWLHAPRHTIKMYFETMEHGKMNKKFSTYEVQLFKDLLTRYPSQDGSSPTEEELKMFRKDVLKEVLDRTKASPFTKFYFKYGDERYDFTFYLDHDVVVVDPNKWGLVFDEDFLEEELGTRFISRADLRKNLSKHNRWGDSDEISEDEKGKADAWLHKVIDKVDALVGRDDDDFGGRFFYAKFVNNGDVIRVVRDVDDELTDYNYSNSETLTINWGAVKNARDINLIERELMAYVLAHDGYMDTRFHFLQAQNKANELIQRNWDRVVDYQKAGIDHKVEPEEYMRMFEALWSQETEDSVMAFNTLRGLSESAVDPQRIEDGLFLLNEVENVDPRIVELLTANVYRTKEGFARYGMDEDKKYKIELFGFDDMQEISDVDGVKAYYFKGYAFIELQSFDYIKYKKDVIYRHENTLYRSSEKQVIEWELESKEYVKFGEGFCYTRVGDISFAANQIKEITEQLRVVDKNTSVMKQTALIDGHVDTSVPLKYGKGNWDKPVRFFEDVVQNHLNAGDVSINFLLEREGVQVWVKGEEILNDEIILGIKFEDNGKGYAPESLERMGRTEKDSPLDEGKYGEGTKMLMAAACRNQIGLVFDSYCLRDGEHIAWSATAETGTRKIIEKGGVSEVNMAGFNLQSTNSSQNASATTIIFKDLESDFYKSCIEVVDPRSGGGGLSKYVRTLPGGVEITSSVGPVKVLADEKGDIYENGILMSTVTTALGSLDVPDISANRERDTIKGARLVQYVDFLMSHTTDPDLVEKVLEKLIKGSTYNYIDIKDIFDKKEGLPINIGVWKKVAKESFGDVIIYNSVTTPQTTRFLNYHGYNTIVSVYGSDGADRLKKACLPSVDELVKRSKLVPALIPEETRHKVEQVVDILADEVLKIIDEGRLSEAVNKQFVEVLRDKKRLHETIEYSKLHPFILGEAKDGIQTVISEYLLHKTSELNMVLLHEWAHHLSRSGDLDPKFVACLLGIGLGVKK